MHFVLIINLTIDSNLHHNNLYSHHRCFGLCLLICHVEEECSCVRLLLIFIVRFCLVRIGIRRGTGISRLRWICRRVLLRLCSNINMGLTLTEHTPPCHTLDSCLLANVSEPHSCILLSANIFTWPVYSFSFMQLLQ